MTTQAATTAIDDTRATIRQAVALAEEAIERKRVPFVDGVMMRASICTLRQLEDELAYRARDVERCGERAQEAIEEIRKTLARAGAPSG